MNPNLEQPNIKPSVRSLVEDPGFLQERINRIEIVPTKSLKIEGMNLSREQEAVGDLNGSYESFVDHLLNKRLVKVLENGKLEWVGGDTKTVFIGDVLGDRHPEGFQVYREMVELAEQAEKVGGEISWIAGNHENLALSFLFGHNIQTDFLDSRKEIFQIKDAAHVYPGLFEPLRYLPESSRGQFLETFNQAMSSELKRMERAVELARQSEQVYSDTTKKTSQAIIDGFTNKIDYLKKYQQVADEGQAVDMVISMSSWLPDNLVRLMRKALKDNKEEILLQMHEKDPNVIKGIENAKLIDLSEGIVYLHPSCHYDFIKKLISEADDYEELEMQIEILNEKYQDFNKKLLSAEQLTRQQEKEFLELRDYFLRTPDKGDLKNNRIDYYKDSFISRVEIDEINRKVEKLGIKCFVYGHTAPDEDVDAATKEGKTHYITIDRNAYKGSDGGLGKSPQAGVSFKKDGMAWYF